MFLSFPGTIEEFTHVTKSKFLRLVSPGPLRLDVFQLRCVGSPAADGNQQVQAADPPGLAQLSEADRKLAKAQKNCPVSGEPLGGMGKPIKLSVKSRTVFLCCNGCKAEFLAHTDKYLKKLDQSK